MEVNAKSSREWRDRMVMILLMLVGSAAWFFYDGFVAYPKFNVKADAYAELKKVYGEDSKILGEKWKERAIENDWKIDDDVPEHRKDEAQQIRWGSGLLAAAALFLIWVIREARRVITADSEKFLGIKKAFPPFNSLVSVRFDSVVGIDKRKWDKKGIAGIFYRENGAMKCVLVDDYKYASSERILEKCEQIVAEKKAAKSGK